MTRAAQAAIGLALLAALQTCSTAWASSREWADRNDTSPPGATLGPPAKGATDNQLPFTLGDNYPMGYAQRLLAGNFDAVPGVDLVTDGGTIWLNDGHGKFTAGSSLGYLVAFAVGDMDMDGFDDIVTIGLGSSKEVTVYHCNGDGTFTAVTLWTLDDGSVVDGIAVADVSGDGYPDVLIPSGSREALTVILVHAGHVVDTHTYPSEPAEDSRYDMQVGVADFNNDGHMDVAVGGTRATDYNSGSVRFFLGDGHGEFTLGPKQSFGTLAVYDMVFPSPMAVADLDGDGWVDIVLPEQPPAIWWNDEHGAFTDTTRQRLVGFGEHTPLSVRDLDGDGHQDVIGGHGTEWCVAYGAGHREFNVRYFLAPFLPRWAATIFAVDAEDVDENGWPDLLAIGGFTSPSAIQLLVLKGMGGRRFAGGSRHPLNFIARMAAVDFEAKGRDDLLADSEGGVWLLRTDADGDVGTAQAFPAGHGFSAVNLDDDGRTDLVWNDGALLSVLLDGEHLASYDAGAFQTTGDFNADGRVDVLIRGEGVRANEFGILHGVGGGLLRPVEWVKTSMLGPATPTALDAPDVNNDGYADLIVESRRGGRSDSAVVLLNDHAGSFVAEDTLVVLAGGGDYVRLTAVRHSDFDQDGAVDLLLCYRNSNPTSVATLWWGAGDGSFTEGNIYARGEVSDFADAPATVGDVDGSGYADIFVAGWTSNDCIMLEVAANRGNRVFDRIELRPYVYRVSWPIVLGDFDGSGWDDVAFLDTDNWSYGTEGLVVVLNTTPPKNSPPDCSGALPSVSVGWPPSRDLVPVRILGVVDPDGDAVNVTATSISQDEPPVRRGVSGDCADGKIDEQGTAWVRMERDGSGNGRVYRISFTATDARGLSCLGAVAVCVPHNQGKNAACVDDGQRFNLLVCERGDLANAAITAETAGSPTLSLSASALGRMITLEYSLPEASPADLSMFDVAGRRVATIVHGPLRAGDEHATLDARGLPQGLYFARLRTEQESLTRTILLLE